MSLSDCPKCWGTPCECGHMGYLTFWLDAPTKDQHNHDVLVRACSTLPADVFELLMEEVTALRETTVYAEAIAKPVELLPMNENGEVFTVDGTMFAVDLQWQSFKRAMNVASNQDRDKIAIQKIRELSGVGIMTCKSAWAEVPKQAGHTLLHEIEEAVKLARELDKKFRKFVTER